MSIEQKLNDIFIPPIANIIYKYVRTWFSKCWHCNHIKRHLIDYIKHELDLSSVKIYRTRRYVWKVLYSSGDCHSVSLNALTNSLAHCYFDILCHVELIDILDHEQDIMSNVQCKDDVPYAILQKINVNISKN